MERFALVYAPTLAELAQRLNEIDPVIVVYIDKSNRGQYTALVDFGALLVQTEEDIVFQSEPAKVIKSV